MMQPEPFVLPPGASLVSTRLRQMTLVILMSLACLCAAWQARADTRAAPWKLDLSPAEQAWLAAHPVIRLGIDNGYGPYSFLDAQGQFQGIVKEFLDQLGPALGVRFEIVSDLTWPELMAAVEARRIDAVATVTHRPERDAFLAFTAIYLPTPLVVMTRTDTPQLNSLLDLERLNLALVEGYSSSKEIVSRYPGLRPRYVGTPLDGLRAVSSGLTDAYVGVLGVNTFLAAQHGITNLKVNAGFDMEVNGQRFGVRKDWPELARLLDRALTAMPAQQKNAIFTRWMPQQDEVIQRLGQPTLITRLSPYLLGFAVVAVLGYLAILLWNHQLRRELARRKTGLEHAQSIAHMGDWSMDLANGQLQCSDELFRIAGQPPRIMDRSMLGECLHPDDRDAFERYLDQLGTRPPGDPLPPHTLRLLRPDGSMRWLEMSGETEHDKLGMPVRVLGTALDITERRQQEEELKRLHSILSALVEGSTDAIFVKDHAGRYLVCNQAMAELVGRPQEDLIGSDDYALFSAESAERFRADDQRIMGEGFTRTYEENVETPSSTHTYLTTKGPLVIDGEVRGVFGLARDISERKQIENALLESEQRLRLFIDHAPAALAMFDRKMHYLAVSQRWLSDYKLEENEVIGQSHYAVFPDIPEHWKAIHQRGLAGEVIQSREDHFDRHDGSVQWLRWEVRPWFAAKRTIGGIVIFAEDITESKKAEQALHESEARFVATFEQAAVGIAIVSPEGHWLRVNQKLCDIVGYDEQELLACTFQDITHPDDLEADLGYVQQMLAHALDTYSMEKRYIRKDGSQVWINLTVALVWQPDNTPDYFISIIEDISARKAAEQAHTESEARFRQLFEQNPAPILVYERDSLRLLEVNEAFVRHYGYSHEEALALLLTDLYPEEEQQPIHDLASSLEGLAYVGEWHHIRKDGSRITIEARSHDFEFEGRSARIAVIADITERKLAEQAIQASEARYRSLVEMAPFPAVITRMRDGILVYGNRRAEIQYGITREQGIGQPAERFYQDTSQRARFLQHLKQDGKVNDLEVRMLTAAGEPFWALVSASIVEFGNEAAIFTAINDITTRKQTEAALQEQEAFFRLIAENMGDMVAVLDLEGRRVYNSPSYRDLFGDPNAMKGTDSFAEVHPDDRDKVRAVFMETVRSGRGHRIDFRFVQPDGHIRHIESQGGVIRDAEGHIERVVVVSRDVTDRRQMEDEIRELNTELEQRVRERTTELAAANKELETFTYSVSHDLKAPLRGIDGYSKLMLEDYRDKLDPPGIQLLDNVRHGVAQMNQLIEDLLNYSRMERRSLNRQAVDLSVLVERVLDPLQADIQAQGMIVETDLDGLTAHADPQGLSIVVRNLIDNALKFSRDSQPPRLTISGKAGDKSITLTFRDNGIGFDMQFQHRIFEIFQRLQRAENYPGTGVGLAIVHKAMQRMGGRVWAESAPGQGAAFHLELPR